VPAVVGASLSRPARRAANRHATVRRWGGHHRGSPRAPPARRGRPTARLPGGWRRATGRSAANLACHPLRARRCLSGHATGRAERLARV